MSETRCKWIYRMGPRQGNQCPKEALPGEDYCYIDLPKATSFFAYQKRIQGIEEESQRQVNTR